MDLDDDELAYTREDYTHDIRRKDLMLCTESELRIRCSFDERYIKELERRISELRKKLKEEER